MLNFTSSQMNRLEDGSYAQFEKRCIDFLRHHQPQVAGMTTEAKEREAVRAGVQSAHLRGFSAQCDVVLYLYLRQLLGAGFDTGSSHPELTRLMNDTAVSPAVRIDNTLAFLAHWLDQSEVAA